MLLCDLLTFAPSYSFSLPRRSYAARQLQRVVRRRLQAHAAPVMRWADVSVATAMSTSNNALALLNPPPSSLPSTTSPPSFCCRPSYGASSAAASTVCATNPRPAHEPAAIIIGSRRNIIGSSRFRMSLLSRCLQNIRRNGAWSRARWRLTLGVSGIDYVTSHLPPPTSHLPPHTSHLTPHTSHLTPHTSHLTPHTSHLTPHTSHLSQPAPRIPSLQMSRRVVVCHCVPCHPAALSRPRCRAPRAAHSRLPFAASKVSFSSCEKIIHLLICLGNCNMFHQPRLGG
jgi:hypothetical protein